MVDADLVEVDVVEGDGAGRHDYPLDEVGGEDEAEEGTAVPPVTLDELDRTARPAFPYTKT